MSLEEYQVTSVTKIPTSNPTQIRLAVVPKPSTPQHTPVSTITLSKGVPAGQQTRHGVEDPKDVAAIIYLSTADFNTANGKTLTFVNYVSTDVPGQPIETISNFNF
jgi:hypothetical protein